MSYNHSCESSVDLRTYQHYVYAVVYSVILAPGLLGNVLAIWVFRVYVRETKKAVVFMMNLAVADLLQVKVFAASYVIILLFVEFLIYVRMFMHRFMCQILFVSPHL